MADAAPKKKKKSKPKSEFPQIPYATIARFIGKPYGPAGEILTIGGIEAMVTAGMVAPNPKAKAYGDAQSFYDEAMLAADAINTMMEAQGLKQRLRVQVFTPKVK